MFERMTTEARSVLAGVRRHATAAGRDQTTLRDLAAALAVPVGNTAELWPASPTEPAREVPAEQLRFDGEVRKVLEQAVQVALRQRAGHIGTEHVLAALVRTGPADVVIWLADRGATAEAVDALLARLDGGPGVERLPAEPTPAQDRRWRRATARARDGRRASFPIATILVVIAVTAVLFVLCVWGP